MVVSFCDCCGKVRSVGMETNAHWRSMSGDIFGFCEDCFTKVDEFVVSLEAKIDKYEYIVPVEEETVVEDND